MPQTEPSLQALFAPKSVAVIGASRRPAEAHTREAFQERTELGNRYLDDLMILLSPEQRERLSQFRRRGTILTTQPGR